MFLFLVSLEDLKKARALKQTTKIPHLEMQTPMVSTRSVQAHLVVEYVKMEIAQVFVLSIY